MKNKFLEVINHYRVLTPMDLMYNRDVGFLLTNEEINSFKDYLSQNDFENITRLNLNSFDSKYISIKNNGELFDLVEEYILLNEEMKNNSYNNSRKVDFNYTNDNKNLNLNIENVYNITKENLEFNNNNIIKLYENMVKNIIDSSIYCFEQKSIKLGKIKTQFKSVPMEKLENCMESLVKFINTDTKENNIEFLKPFIAQYYLIYLNQFVDYNDEFSRLITFWLMNKSEYNYPNNYLQIISVNKFMYYRSLQISRKMNNDISYFIEYIINVLTEDLLCNKNINYIEQELRNNAEHLTSAQIEYTKNILIYSKNKWFGWRDYIKFSDVTYSKQGVLKILNSLNKIGILEIQLNSKKEKMFKINNKYLKYNKKREF